MLPSQLRKVTHDYKNVEEMLDVEDSCWALLHLLWLLNILKYPDDVDGENAYSHQRDVVEMLYLLYSEMAIAGAFDHE